MLNGFPPFLSAPHAEQTWTGLSCWWSGDRLWLLSSQNDCCRAAPHPPSPSIGEGQALQDLNTRPRGNLLRFGSLCHQNSRRPQRTTYSQPLLSVLLLAPPSWSTWEGKTAVPEMPQNRPLWALLSVLFPHFAAKPLRGPLNGEQVALQGHGHSPDAAAQGKLPRWALVLPGERRAWHHVLAGRGLALQEVRAASRSTCRPRHALWPRGTWADAPLWEQTHLRFKKE